MGKLLIWGQIEVRGDCEWGERFCSKEQGPGFCGKPISMPRLTIFFSHVTAESQIADLLKTHIEDDFLGLIELFVSSDRTAIPVGSKWLEEVTKNLQAADLHMILCSSESIARPWINFEAGAAHLRGVPIVPLCYYGLTPAQLPVPISESQGVEICKPDGLDALYKMLADALGSTKPKVNIQALARQLQDVEAQLEQRTRDTSQAILKTNEVEVIKNPRTLCVSSEQLYRLGVENQLQKVIEAFPASVEHTVICNSRALREKLSKNEFDIVHVGAFICPRSGDLYFSEVDLNSGLPVTEPVDLLPSEAFTALLDMARVRLVVITSCDALSLAVNLTTVCHAVAAREMVSAKMMAAWVDAFYTMLPQKPLSKALEFAIRTSGAPMRLFAKEAPVDLVVEVSHAGV